MANTKNITNIVVGQKETVVYATILAVDAQENNLVIYDSSVIAGLLNIPDPLNCVLLGIKYSTNSVAGIIKLNWDATTPVAAWALPYQHDIDKCFVKIGGLPNQGGVGITGDITLTTTGLAAAEVISLVLTVRVY